MFSQIQLGILFLTLLIGTAGVGLSAWQSLPQGDSNESPLPVQVQEETPLSKEATTTPVSTTNAVKTTSTPVVSKVTSPATVSEETTVTATTTTKKKASSSSTPSINLTLIGDSVKNVSEKDVLVFQAIATLPDGAKVDVTTTATWNVVGSIGSIHKGVFTAKLDASVSEFGRAPGAITASWTDPVGDGKGFIETDIFYVEAFVPEVLNIGGQ